MAARLALTIDGYRVTGGVEECQRLGNAAIDEIRRTGRSRATAADLWIALFWHQRYFRFIGSVPKREDLVVWNNHVSFVRRLAQSHAGRKGASHVDDKTTRAEERPLR